jgi:hypothetical protein
VHEKEEEEEKKKEKIPDQNQLATWQRREEGKKSPWE